MSANLVYEALNYNDSWSTIHKHGRWNFSVNGSTTTAPESNVPLALSASRTIERSAVEKIEDYEVLRWVSVIACPITMLAGLGGNILVILVLGVSVRLRDNIVSTLLMGVAHVDILELLLIGSRRFVQGLTRWDWRQGHSDVCRYINLTEQLIRFEKVSILFSASAMRVLFLLFPARITTCVKFKCNIVGALFFLCVTLGLAVGLAYPSCLASEVPFRCHIPDNYTEEPHDDEVRRYIYYAPIPGILLLDYIIGFIMLQRLNTSILLRRYRGLSKITFQRGIQFSLLSAFRFFNAFYRDFSNVDARTVSDTMTIEDILGLVDSSVTCYVLCVGSSDFWYDLTHVVPQFVKRQKPKAIKCNSLTLNSLSDEEEQCHCCRCCRKVQHQSSADLLAIMGTSSFKERNVQFWGRALSSHTVGLGRFSTSQSSILNHNF